MYRAILWDNDGVLVMTEKWYFEATKRVMQDEGYTLTLDLKMNGNLKILYQEFESLLKNNKTKMYLTKDSLMSEQYFKNTYKNFNKFSEIKEKYDPLKLINSFQSQRLGVKN